MSSLLCGMRFLGQQLEAEMINAPHKYNVYCKVSFSPTSFCKILLLKLLINGGRGKTFEVQKLKDLRNRLHFPVKNKYIYISLT
jgi:hypothetical protein